MTVERIQRIACVLCDFVKTHDIGARGFILEVPKVVMPEESLYLKRQVACQLRKTLTVRYGGIFCSVKGDYMKMKIPADLLRDSDTV
jgi:hypothetical protein